MAGPAPGREVLYEAMARAEIDAEAMGFDQHASQVVTDEGDYQTVPQWRQDQIDERRAEEAEDLAELRMRNPRQFKREMQKNQKMLAQKEAIYALVKQAEAGELEVLVPEEHRDDSAGGTAPEPPAKAPVGHAGYKNVPVDGLRVESRREPKLNRNRRTTERFEPAVEREEAPLSQPHRIRDSTQSVSVPVSVYGGEAAVISPAPRAQASTTPWLVGTMDRAKCETLVIACMQGDFLVRKSASSAGYVLCVHDSGQAINYTITAKAGGSMFSFTQADFDSLETVVEFARKTPLKSVVNPGERLVLGHAALVERWFAAGLSRGACESAVSRAAHGDFAVRLSSTGDKYVLVVNDRGQPFSYSITTKIFPGSVAKHFTFGGTVHESVEDVVEAMKTTAFKSGNTFEMTLNDSAL